MTGYLHLSPDERDQVASLRSEGLGCRAIARRLGRSASTISRELRRNSTESGRYRPHLADGGYMLRRQRPCVLETDAKLAAYVTERLSEGWTPEQIAGRLRRGLERGLQGLCTETIYSWIYRKGQKAAKLWRFLTRRRARRRKRHGRASRDTIAEKVHISQRTAEADARSEAGHWEGDLIICKHSRPVLVLHERKSRITLMTRLAGKTAGETVAALMAILRRLDPRMRGSITFDNDTCFARHTLLRGMLSATTYFCDAYASWQKGGVENANGRIRRWLPRKTDLDTLTEDDIQEIAMTINLTPRKCLRFRSPVEAFLRELGRDLEIRFA
jgi:transposase, IS30 family